MTTRASLEDRKTRIRLDELPQTLRDGVAFTRLLNFRYLWVDSLCIIQDDTDDWKQEVGRMVFVYGDAYLVLAAVRAASTGDEFLSERPQGYIQAHITGQDDKGKGFAVVAVSSRMGTTINDARHAGFGPVREVWDIERVPLWTRAWAFQERFAARAVLHFCDDELFWECRESLFCECGGVSHIRGLVEPSQEPLIKSAYADTVHRSNVWGRAGLWYSLVSTFSHLSLSHEGDRLRAIAGVAQQVHTTRDVGHCLAGIFSNHFVTGLCWTSTITTPAITWTPRIEPSHPYHFKPSDDPSWSWASAGACCSVEFTRPGVEHVRLVGWDEHAKGESRYTSYRNGSLTVQGKALLGRISPRTPSDKIRRGHHPLYLLVPGQDSEEPLMVRSQFCYDQHVTSYASIGEEVRLLRLGFVESSPARCARDIYLVLRPRAPGAWERIGIMEIMCETNEEALEYTDLLGQTQTTDAADVGRSWTDCVEEQIWILV